MKGKGRGKGKGKGKGKGDMWQCSEPKCGKWSFPDRTCCFFCELPWNANISPTHRPKSYAEAAKVKPKPKAKAAATATAKAPSQPQSQPSWSHRKPRPSVRAHGRC